MTVKELKMALAALGSGVDDFEFQVWLPGSRIYLARPDPNDHRPPAPMVTANTVLIEGNLTEDSVLAKMTMGV